MNEKKHDINDDEIRIISSSKERNEDHFCCDMPLGADEPQDSGLNVKDYYMDVGDCESDDEFSEIGIYPDARSSKKSKWWLWTFVAGLCIVVGLFVAWLVSVVSDDEDPVVVNEAGVSELIDVDNVSEIDTVTDRDAAVTHGYVEVCDTTIGGVPLLVITPFDATPRLQVGTDALNDSAAVLVVQAADVRGDNGEIVGAFVADGRLLSKGQSKSGFCAIIGGQLTVGVAEATPYLEQALENEGYFFRQYPLVVANQIVENKPKGRALRKALAELNGKTVVVIGRKRQTFHEFSQTLVDLGVSNAIYLVGSLAYGYARDCDGNMIEFGLISDKAPENTNYLIWK